MNGSKNYGAFTQWNTIQQKELLPFATTWMEQESIMLSEVSQAVKDKYHMISRWNLINKTNKEAKYNQKH